MDYDVKKVMDIMKINTIKVLLVLNENYLQKSYKTFKQNFKNWVFIISDL